MNLIKIKTKDGWVTLYRALFESFLSKYKNLADLTDKDAARKNLELTGDVETHNHDSRYMPIIQEKYDDLNNKIQKLNNKVDDQKHNFFTAIKCNLFDFSIQPNGWYLWEGLISGVRGTWLIRRVGAESAINYIAYSIEDPRVVVSSNDLQTWYPYGYWHANLYKGLKSRLDGNEFVKSKNGENNIALKYEQKDGEDKKTLHAYVDGVEVPLASQSGSLPVIESGKNQFGHYIMYSDGLKIQSGHIEGHEQYLTIVFPKPFNSTSYNFTRTSTFKGRNDGNLEFAYQGSLQDDRTNTSIKIYIGEYSYASDWIAIGY